MKSLIFIGFMVLLCGCTYIVNNIGDSAIDAANELGRQTDEYVEKQNTINGIGTQKVSPTNSSSRAIGGLVINNTIFSGKEVSPQTTATLLPK